MLKPVTDLVSTMPINAKLTEELNRRFPPGEICKIMPITPEAQYDGTSRGRCVFEPGSAHYPTVTNREAPVLYMLPDGKINFSDRQRCQVVS